MTMAVTLYNSKGKQLKYLDRIKITVIKKGHHSLTLSLSMRKLIRKIVYIQLSETNIFLKSFREFWDTFILVCIMYHFTSLTTTVCYLITAKLLQRCNISYVESRISLFLIRCAN